MSRSFTSTALSAMFAQETSDAYVTLLTIDHASLGSPIRYCDAENDVTSGVNLFTAASFRLVLPTDSDGAPPRTAIEVDAVDRAIIDTALSLSSPPDVSLEWVRAAAPGVIEMGPAYFLIEDVSYDKLSLKASLAYEPVLNEPIPADRRTPVTHPGIFK